MNPRIMQAIFEHRQLAYAITDRALRVIEVGGDHHLLGAESEQWIGKPLLDMAYELVGSETEMAAILSGRTPQFQIDLINRTDPDDTTKYVRYSELPHRNEQGAIAGILHLVEDVTEQAENQQRLTQQRNELLLLHAQLDQYILNLKEANAELRQINEFKSTFVATAAHELRTPLTSVQGFLEIVLDENSLTDRQRTLLRTAWQSSERLHKIVNDLLDVLRIELGNIDITLRPESLAEVIDEVVDALRPQIGAKSHQLVVSIPPDLPPVLCDVARMVQIVTNLLNNAIKYTPTGGSIEVQAAVTAAGKDVRLSIFDHGIGISQSDQAALFTRFFRAADAQQQTENGFGLGLYITRSLVDMHGGRIWMESEPGQGSTFHVTIPIAGKQMAAPQKSGVETG